MRVVDGAKGLDDGLRDRSRDRGALVLGCWLSRRHNSTSRLTEGISLPDSGKSPDSEDPPVWEMIARVGLGLAQWVSNHSDEIEAFVVWGRVNRACDATALYAPPGPAWHHISQAEGANDSSKDLESLILSLYGAGGIGHDALRDEILSAPLLKSRKREVAEVLDSLAEARHYVTICGALPLVEGLLAEAYGKWKKHPSSYPLTARLSKADAFTPEEESLLLLNQSAFKMLRTGIPKVWKSHPAKPGKTTTALNRNVALHGTGRGWDTRENAIKAVLLMAAAARIAEPLLAPRSVPRG
jgi:hypothetical protein